MSHSSKQKAKERSELAYDALITRLNRAQAQLGAKADKSTKMSLLDYRKWFDEKKAEVIELQAQIPAAKAARSEARRQFNSWQPAHREEWIDWPDCEGFWWYYTEDGDASLYISYVAENPDADKPGEKPFTPLHPEWQSTSPDGKWRFQPEPETMPA